MGESEDLLEVGRDEDDPDAALRERPDDSSWIARRAPTSTPRVGSSRIRIRGSWNRHLPNSTFCWLPPDIVLTIALGDAGVTARSASSVRTSSRSLRFDEPAEPGDPPTRAEEGQRGVGRHRLVEQQTLFLAALGQHRHAGANARCGDAPANSAPSSLIVPPSTGSAPKIARASSERPLPTSPARPTISPAATVSDTSCRTPARRRSSTSSERRTGRRRAPRADSRPTPRARASRSRAWPRSPPPRGPSG